MDKAGLFFVMLLAMSVMVCAAEYSNSTFSSESDLVNVTFGLSFNCTGVDLGTTYVTPYGCAANTGYGTLTTETMNFTASGTYDSSIFPTIVASSGNTITIVNGLNFSVPVSLNVSTNGILPSSPRVTYSNASSEYPAYSYDNGVMSFNVSLPPGVSTLLIDGSGPAAVLRTCNDGGDFLQNFSGVLPFLGTLLGLLLVFGIIYVVKNPSGDFLGNTQMIIFLMGMLVAGIFVLFALSRVFDTLCV